MKEPKISILWDNEANVWIAESYEIGLILEDSSFSRLLERVSNTVPELVALNFEHTYFDTLFSKNEVAHG